MAIAINGSGTITGISQGGLNDNIITQSELANTGVAGNGPAFSARAGSNVACTTGVPTKLLSTSIDFDTASCYASSRFTPNVAGYYLITAAAGAVSAWSSGAFSATYIYKNGASYIAAVYSPTTNFNNGNTSAVIYFNGSTDYVEVYGLQNTGSTQNLALGGFTGALVRAA